MNRLRRAWRVFADPPASDLASFLRNFGLPVGVAMFVVRLFLGPLWGPGLTDLVWMVVALSVARQRDAARAAVKASQVLQASRHADSGERPPRANSAPPAPHPATEHHHRNEDR